jgi:tRNA-binding EMAP/Myf-like protein|tara:strand:+ start:143 stop:406 length:264 start_codon:yes stop_codon:yes gene_type:complete
MSITGQHSSTTNTFCIQYWKQGDSANPKVMRRINSDGMVVSAKTYDEVFFYSNLQKAFPDAKWLQENGFDIKIRKCNLARNNKFWLI